MKKEIVVILDNIRSAHNVGSIFRTSDGAGVSKIILSGYTPAPIDRFGRVQPEIAKTSLGATETIPWELVNEAAGLEQLKKLRQEGYAIVAVEQAINSIPLSDFSVPDKVCYIFGNEINGVQPAYLNVSDLILEISLHGQKESLNVAVSAGIVLFQKQ